MNIKSKRRISKIYAGILTVHGVLLSSYYLFFKEFANDHLWFSAIITLLLPLVWFFFPIEKLIHNIIPWALRFGLGDEKRIIGDWLINIEYIENGKKQKRSGTMTIKPTMFGMVIRGGRLIDSSLKKEVVTMASWSAEDVYLYDTKDGLIMTYIYNTNEGNTLSTNRVGIVSCLVKQDLSKPATGVFRDAEVQSNPRKGSVRLIKKVN